MVLYKASRQNANRKCSALLKRKFYFTHTGFHQMIDVGLEIFQELVLEKGQSGKSIRDLLLSNVTAPWSHLTEREEEISSSSIADDDVIVIARDEKEGVPACSLLLWSQEGGYRVVNIVPRAEGSLGIRGYNSILRDFVRDIAQPAAENGAFRVVLSDAFETLENMIGAEAAVALIRFSRLANKFTGTAHPSDQQRWFTFLLTAHRSEKKLDSEMLLRLLTEREGWPSDSATELAIQYESGLDLLNFYDAERSL